MKRRALLSTMAAGSLAMAGCPSPPSDQARSPPTSEPSKSISPTPSETPQSSPPTPEDEEELPEDCPTSQDLGVEWPVHLDETSVTMFVEAYEERYYPRVAFDAEPPSRYGSVGSMIPRIENVTEAEGGWRVQFSGTLGVNRVTLDLKATRSEPPEEAEVISRSEFDDERLNELLDEAAKTGEAELYIGAEEVDAYVDRFDNLSAGFDVSSAEPQDSLYVQGDGLTIEVEVRLFRYHADHGWNAWYYVDEHEVWRSGEKDVEPRDGQLLECRTDP